MTRSPSPPYARRLVAALSAICLLGLIPVAAAGAEGATVVGWGENGSGQLGLGVTSGDVKERVAIEGLSDVTQVAAGVVHTLALRTDGTVMSWGRNDEGQLGIGTTTESLRPTPVPGLGNVGEVAAGGFHSLALLGDGTVMAWG